MTDSFFESVGVPENVLFSETGSFNIIHQIGEKVDGCFLNQLALVKFVRKFASSADNGKVLLILTHHTKAHWVSICNKVGLSLGSLQEKGSLVVVDLLKELFDFTKDAQPVDQMENQFSIQNISARCELAIEDLKRTGCRKILVIIEDLTNFLDFSVNFSRMEKQIIQFLMKLKALAISSLEKDRCSLTINSLVQSPEVPAHSIEQTRFAQTIAQIIPTVMFEVSPLSTGFSSQVTGLLKVKCSKQRNVQDPNSKPVQFIRSFHFKLDSNSVRATPL